MFKGEWAFVLGSRIFTVEFLRIGKSYLYNMFCHGFLDTTYLDHALLGYDLISFATHSTLFEFG